MNPESRPVSGGRMRLAAFALIVAGLGLPAAAADGVEAAYKAPGDVPALARRAQSCIAQIPSGATDAPAIVSSDVAGGRVVANITFEYIGAGAIPTTVRGRSTLALAATAGGFRISHTAVEAFEDPAGWRPSGDPYITARLAEIDEDLAACMQRGSPRAGAPSPPEQERIP